MIYFNFNYNSPGIGLPDDLPNLWSSLFLITGSILTIITFLILPPQPYTLIIGWFLYVIGGIL